MKRPMKITTLIMATIAFATTALAGQPIQAQTTAQLQSRRAEIQRKFAEDDFGVYIGPIRWFSHGAERNGVRKELKAIDNELARRNGGVVPTISANDSQPIPTQAMALPGENFRQYAKRLHLRGVPIENSIELEPGLSLITVHPYQKPDSNTQGFDLREEAALGQASSDGTHVREYRRGVFIAYVRVKTAPTTGTRIPGDILATDSARTRGKADTRR